MTSIKNTNKMRTQVGMEKAREQKLDIMCFASMWYIGNLPIGFAVSYVSFLLYHSSLSY